MTAPTDYLIAAYATGSDANNWTVVDTMLTALSSDLTFDSVIEWSHQDYADYIKLGSGEIRGLGTPVITWSFKGLRLEQREALRDFCLTPSAHVYIRTPTNETSGGVRTWADYECYATWVQRAEILSDGLDVAESVEIKFVNCIQVGT